MQSNGESERPLWADKANGDALRIVSLRCKLHLPLKLACGILEQKRVPIGLRRECEGEV